MPLYQPTDTAGQALNTIYAEDIQQFVKTLTGLSDAGVLSLFAPLSNPSTTPSVTLQAGSLTGSYQWGFYWITGLLDGTGGPHITGRTMPSPYSAAQALSSQEGVVSIASIAIPTGVIGWGVVRNKAGGATWYEVPSSEQFANTAGTMPTTYTDNTADTSLSTLSPSSNSTGTSLSGAIVAATLSGIKPTDVIQSRVSPNLAINADLESVTGTATALSDPLTSGAAWTVQAGSFTYSSSGATSGAVASELVAGNAAWKPLVGSGGQNLPLTAQASFTMPSAVPTNAIILDLLVTATSVYRLYSNGSTLYLQKYVSGTETALSSVAQALTAYSTYTGNLSIDHLGNLTAKLYSGSGTGGTLLQTLTATDTSLSGGYLLGVGGDTGVVVSNASMVAPTPDGWTLTGHALSAVTSGYSGQYGVSLTADPAASSDGLQQTYNYGSSVANTTWAYAIYAKSSVGGVVNFSDVIGVKSVGSFAGLGPTIVNFLSTNQWQLVAWSSTFPSTDTDTQISIRLPTPITAGAVVTYDCVQFEPGSVNTPFLPQTQTVQTGFFVAKNLAVSGNGTFGGNGSFGNETNAPNPYVNAGNAEMGSATSNGSYSADAVVGDAVIRNNGGSTVRIGVGGGNSTIQITSTLASILGNPAMYALNGGYRLQSGITSISTSAAAGTYTVTITLPTAITGSSYTWANAVSTYPNLVSATTTSGVQGTSNNQLVIYIYQSDATARTIPINWYAMY